MKKQRRRGGSRRHRPRTTPKWLLKSEQIDQIAQQRCLMVLSVLSGEMPVTDAIQAAGISRGTYYQLETRALNGMLRALLPGAREDGGDPRPRRRIAELEAKVQRLERALRRSERLLALSQRLSRGRPMRSRRISSTPSGRSRSRVSTKEAPTRASIPTTAGVGEP